MVSPHNLPDLIQICGHLEGIPLALELAAARVKALPLEQIRARVSDRFRLLSQGNRSAPPHQQTLRSMLDWSYDLLSGAEKKLLRRLSVFAGGWTLDAAEAVCADDETDATAGNTAPLGQPQSPSLAGQTGQIDRDEMWDLLGQLAEKSLVLVEDDGARRRYRLLEMVRAYAAEKSEAAGERSRLLRRHREYCLALVQEAHSYVHGPEQGRWMQTLDEEYANIRASLHFCRQEASGGEPGLWIAGYLQEFWWTRGYLREGRAFLKAALEHPGAQCLDSARAFALNGAGILASFQGDLVEAAAMLEESLTIRRKLEDPYQIAVVLGNLGAVFLDMGEYGRSHACQEESLAVFRSMDRPWNVASTLTNLGTLALHQGDAVYAQQCYAEAITIRRQLNDSRGIGISLCGLGQAYLELGESAAALPCFEEALTLLRSVKDKLNLSIALLCMRRLLREREDYNAACFALAEALEVCGEIGDALVPQVLQELARLLYARKDHAQAVTLLSIAHTFAVQQGTMLSATTVQERQQMGAELRVLLGEEAYVGAWVEGTQWRLEQAIAHARML